MKKVLIIDDMHTSILGMLRELGLEPDYQPKITREEVMRIIPDYDAVIVRSKTKINKDFLEKASHLELIARAGSGLDIIDMDFAIQKNIHVINAPEGNRDAVAEHALGMLLAMMHRINISDREVRDYIWDRERNRGIEIKYKTIAIIGYGNIGHEFAKRLKGFDCKVLAYDKYDRNYSDAYVQEATMEEIYDQSDIVSLHIPLKGETFELVDRDYLNKFKKSIYLINTSRGEIVKLEDLKEALESGKVTGACLDVLENEKINTLTIAQKEIFEYLIHSDRVILTPHVAGWTNESYKRINEVIIDKIKQFLAGKQS